MIGQRGTGGIEEGASKEEGGKVQEGSSQDIGRELLP